MCVGRHAKPVLGDPNGGLALTVFGSIVAASALLAVLGKLVFGVIGALAGAGIYLVAAAVACTVMTIRDASNARPPTGGRPTHESTRSGCPEGGAVQPLAGRGPTLMGWRTRAQGRRTPHLIR